MAICLECGSEIQPQARFCSQCGAEFRPLKDAPTQAENIQDAGKPPSPPDFGPPGEDFKPPPPNFGPPPATFIQHAPEGMPQTGQNRSVGPAKRKRSAGPALISCFGLVFSMLVCGIGLPSLSRMVMPWFETQLASLITRETVSPVEEPSPPPVVTSLFPQSPAAPSPSSITPTRPRVPLPIEPQLTAAAALPRVSFQGVTFAYNPSLAYEIGKIIMPADQGSAFGPSPEYIHFTFEGYPTFNQTFRPEIRIYRVEDYRKANESAAETVARLQDLLTQKPGRVESGLPFLPVMNADQLFLARAFYFDFQNGSGLRYLTQFGQNIYPINNQDLLYTYQGLTSDGKYYISAVFPIAHPGLPADGSQIPGGDYLAFEQQFQEYVGDVAGLLNGSMPEDFVPDMNMLDNLLWSMMVKPGG